MASPKLLGISGSLRKDSHNSLLLAEAARLFGDAQYTQADINLPLWTRWRSKSRVRMRF